MSDPWTLHDLAVGLEARWQLGELDLGVRREPDAWVLDWGWGADDDSRQVKRLAFARSEGPLQLAPHLADMAVIVRPAEALWVAPEEQARLLAVTPLWVAIQAAGGRHPLAELPCARLSLTWFGDHTREGELCLAARRPLAALQEVDPFRVTTPVLIHNRAAQPLLVERLRLPMLRMPLFQAADGGFWTPRVEVRQADKGEVSLTLTDRPPAEAQRPREVAVPRIAHHSNAVLAALGTVLHHPLFS